MAEKSAINKTQTLVLISVQNAHAEVRLPEMESSSYTTKLEMLCRLSYALSNLSGTHYIQTQFSF